MRRASMVDMMEFGGSSPNTGLDSFQFDPSATTGFDSTMVDMPSDANDRSRTGSSAGVGLSINTQFPSHRAPFAPLAQPGSVYASPIPNSNGLDIDVNSPYLTSAFPSAVTMPTDMNLMSADMSSADLFGSAQFGSPMAGSPIHQSYNGSMMGPTLQDPGGGSILGKEHREPATSTATPVIRQTSTRTNSQENASQSNSLQGSASTQPTNVARPVAVPLTFSPKKLPINGGPQETVNGNALPWVAPPGFSSTTLY